MAKQPKRKIKVTLADGKKHEIRFTPYALVELEGETGISFLDYRGVLGLPADMTPDEIAKAEKHTQTFMKAFKLSRLSLTLWAGLLHENEELTVKEAVNLIPLNKVIEIFIEITNAYVDALGLASGGEDEGESEPKSEQGKNPKGPNPKKS